MEEKPLRATASSLRHTARTAYDEGFDSWAGQINSGADMLDLAREQITRLKRENEDLRKRYTEEKARAEKRERQLVWLSDGLEPACIAGSFYYGATGEIKFDGTPEGLLAAIDEACPEEETR